jgi:hypothetical protein
MIAARSTTLVLLLLLPGYSMALGDDEVSIGTIVADPDAYHLRLVTLRGTVRHVQLLEPYPQPSGAMCYGAYTFRLEDDTGELEVAVLGICGVPLFRLSQVSEGDRVVVQVQIRATSRTGSVPGSDGRPLSGGHRQPLEATATEIVRVGQ